MNRPGWWSNLVVAVAALILLNACVAHDRHRAKSDVTAPAPKAESTRATPAPKSDMEEMTLVETRTPAATSRPTPTSTPAPAAPSSTPSPAPKSDTPEGKPKRVTYAPHVLIDWSVPQVEIEAKVVLRDRNLELLLCTAGTKEHESILATPAQPSKIYEALGLIGLSSGHPPAYDPGTKTPIPATGQRLAIEIQVQVAEGRRNDAAHQWMVLADNKRAMPAPRWVFCGSRKLDNGRLAADSEGTIICVVDFDSALIAIGEAHSASDDALWVATDTATIPEIGTACTVVIRALDDAPLELVLTPENFFKWNDRMLDALELDALIRERTRHHPDQQVVLTEMPGKPNPFARLAAHAIVGSGIKREHLTANLLPRPEKTAPPASDTKEEVNASPADE